MWVGMLHVACGSAFDFAQNMVICNFNTQSHDGSKQSKIYQQGRKINLFGNATTLNSEVFVISKNHDELGINFP